MGKFFSIVCEVIAGVFVYALLGLAFVSGLPSYAKAIALIILLVLASVAMLAGLAWSGFGRWRRDTGLVLLCAAGFTAFAAFTMVCVFSSEEARALMPVGSWALFGSYAAGIGALLGCVALGSFLFRSQAAGHD